MRGRQSVNSLAIANSAERKGFVLGQTLAEIMLLIVFLLLITLGVSWAKVSREYEALIQALRVGSNQGEQTDWAVVFDTLRKENFDLSERNRELSDQLATLTQQLRTTKLDLRDFREITTKKGPLTPQYAAELVQTAEATQKVREELASLGDIDQLASRLETAEKLEQVAEELGGTEKLVEAAGELKQAQIEKASLLREKKQLMGTLKRMEKTLEGKGPGGVLPPCLADKVTGKPYYLYDIALRSDGSEIRLVDFPGRKDLILGLPIGNLKTGEFVSDPQLLQQTRALFKWSVERTCRFYVRVYDETKPYEKEIFKRRLEIVERHFYKLLSRNKFN